MLCQVQTALNSMIIHILVKPLIRLLVYIHTYSLEEPNTDFN